MPFDAPFKLGPFTVDAEGRVTPNARESAPAFLFRWRDRTVRARLLTADGAAGRIALQMTLARVSSTANASDETLRPRSFALLRWLPGSVPVGWRVELLADHRVRLETEPRIELPITAPALVTEITCFLLALGPYLDLLDEVGLAGTGA